MAEQQWVSCEHEFSEEDIEEFGDDADCLKGCGRFYGEEN